MTHPGNMTETDAPTLLLVMDLGEEPPLSEVAEQLAAMTSLWRLTSRVAASGILRIANPAEPQVGVLRTPRIRLGSPLEVLLTSFSGPSVPIAWTVTSFLLMERAIKLVMKWQLHREEMRRMRHGLEAVRAAEAVLDALEEGPGRFRGWASLHPGSPELAAAEKAINTLAKAHVVSVESTGLGHTDRGGPDEGRQ